MGSGVVLDAVDLRFQPPRNQAQLQLHVLLNALDLRAQSLQTVNGC